MTKRRVGILISGGGSNMEVLVRDMADPYADLGNADIVRYYDDTGKRIEIELDDDEFHVPDPKGISNLSELQNDEDEEDDAVEFSTESELEKVKKLLRIKSENREPPEDPKFQEVVEI